MADSLSQAGMHIEWWPVTRPKPYPKNARKLTQKAIEKVALSIKEFGWRQPIVCDAHDTIVIGHLRLASAQWLKLDTVPVHVASELSPAKIRALRLMDNRSHEEFVWDEDLLRQEMVDLQALGDLDLSLSGFDARELDALLIQPDDNADECPDVPAAQVTRTGDLWLMGEHRLLCGDATKADDVARLMAGKVAELVLTDPPYGVNVVKKAMVGADFGVAKKGNYAPVVGDDSTDAALDAVHLCPSLGIERLIFWGGNYYADQLPPSGCWLVWDKRGDTGIENTFADCELAWTSLGQPTRIYRQLWNGMIREGEHEKRAHPTQKPIRLMEWCITKFADGANVVLDPFLGSGTTLIAAESTGRICYGLEIAPQYCDVIVTRWQNFTGCEATLAGHGATFAQVKDGRLREWEDNVKEECLEMLDNKALPVREQQQP